jgi:hypothetical protein
VLVILTALGLAETATEADAIASITALQEQVAADATAIAAHKTAAPDLTLYVGKAEFEVATHRADAAEAELADIKTAAHSAAIDAVLDAAITSGKLAPAGRVAMRTLAEKDLDAVNALLAAAPVVLDAHRQAPAGSPATNPALTDAQVAHCKQYQIDPAAFSAALATLSK